jgi:hypothetical protein
LAIYRWVIDGSCDRVSGAYVYLLLCRDENKIYIKVGQTTNPEQRFHSLKNGCPVTPRSFSVIPVPGKIFSARLELSLHGTFAKWRVAGEWFAMSMDDKQEFNAKLHSVLSDHSIPLWPMKITKVSAKYLIDLAKKRQAYFRHRWSRSGKAYKDFTKHSA